MRHIKLQYICRNCSKDLITIVSQKVLSSDKSLLYIKCEKCNSTNSIILPKIVEFTGFVEFSRITIWGDEE